MKSFLQFITENTSGTYVGVHFSETSNADLKLYAESLGLNPLEDFHSTIVYSEKTLLGVEPGTTDFNDMLEPTGIKYLGEIGSKYRAIVLTVNSEKLAGEYQSYIDNNGYEPRFPEYTQHISLAYEPPEDLDLEAVPLPNFKITVQEKYVQDLDLDYTGK